MLNFLQGKKTYIVGTAGLVVVGLYLAGILSPDMANVLLTVFGFGGLITLRSAVSKIEQQ